MLVRRVRGSSFEVGLTDQGARWADCVLYVGLSLLMRGTKAYVVCPSVGTQAQSGALLRHRARSSARERSVSLSGAAGAGQGEVLGRASWLPVLWSSPSESGWVGAVAAAFLAGSPEESFVITT